MRSHKKQRVGSAHLLLPCLGGNAYSLPKMWAAGKDTSSDSDSGSDEAEQVKQSGRRWLDASDSDDSDDDVRAPIKSAAEKKWDALVGVAKAVTNLLKNSDWGKLFDGACGSVGAPACAWGCACGPRAFSRVACGHVSRGLPASWCWVWVCG
jgi:hypothetical protein